MISSSVTFFRKMAGWFRDRAWAGWTLRLAGTVLFLYWIFSYVDIEQFRLVAISPNWWYLLIMVLFSLLFVLIGAYKFWYMLNTMVVTPFKPFLFYFLVATSIGTFTPASVGDFSLAAFLKRRNIPTHQSVSVILVDRVVTVMIYGAFFLPLTLGLLLDSSHFWWSPVVVLLLSLLILGSSTNESIRRVIQRILDRVNWKFLTELINSIFEIFSTQPRALLVIVILTFLRCFVSGLVVQFALYAAGEYNSFIPVLLTTNSISLLNLLPVSLSGLGVYEGGGVVILSRLGFDPDRVLAGLTYQRIYVIVYSLIILLLAYLFDGLLKGIMESSLESDS